LFRERFDLFSVRGDQGELTRDEEAVREDQRQEQQQA
jgi:hypothetical protein